MTNRRALRISNGSVLYKRDLIRFSKKSKKEKELEKMRLFNPKLYYGIRNV